MEDVGMVFNPSRHKHGLRYTEELPSYKCSGCKGWGANTGYKCPSCPEFVLHKICCASDDEIVRGVFPEGPFKFRTTSRLRHDCDVCGVLIRGFLFESSRGSKVHPLCLDPPLKLRYSGHPDHVLSLNTNQERVKYSCSLCREEHKEWKYRCTVVTCNVKLDMNCAVIAMHNLSQHGISQVYEPSKAKHALKKVGKVGTAIGIVVAGTVVHVAVGEAGDALAGDALSGDALAGDALSGDALAGDALAGDALSGDALAGDALADRGRVDRDGGEDEGRGPNGQ